MSIQTDSKRILRWGLINFYRNTVVSIASVLMMTVTLTVIGIVIFLNAVLGFSLAQIGSKVDVNVYFYPSVSEAQVLQVQQNLQQLPEVASVEYISEDQALSDFRTRHASDYLTLQALDELGANPLGATLNIRAKESGQYESIANTLDQNTSLSNGSTPIIEKVNYAQNKAIIERLTSIMRSVQTLGLAITAFFIVISILITFNTIRLAIYMSREEIATMRMVGAENKYIQGPFMTEGIVYGIVSAILTLVLFVPITYWLTGHTQAFFGGLSLFRYYGDNFFQFLAILLVAGILLGMISAWFAIRKYLRK
ncbi:MAG: cell division protein cell division transport system permease protein [Patescibacteria group bacterium]|nr:cell division protein cell division transport system permease protein [Patescibacteria group bacterium]